MIWKLQWIRNWFKESCCEFTQAINLYLLPPYTQVDYIKFSFFLFWLGKNCKKEVKCFHHCLSEVNNNLFVTSIHQFTNSLIYEFFHRNIHIVFDFFWIEIIQPFFRGSQKTLHCIIKIIILPNFLPSLIEINWWIDVTNKI